MSYDLRPLSLAELLDRAFSLYRRHWRLFVGIMAPPLVALLVITVILQLFGVAGRTEAPIESEQAVALVLAGLGVSVVMLVFYFVGYAVALGATTAAVSGIYKGDTPTVGGSYGAMRGAIGRLSWLLLLVSLRVFLAFLLVMAGVLAIAGVGSAVHPALGVLLLLTAGLVGAALCTVVVTRYAVAVPPAVLEDTTARESIRRSIELTGGNRLRVLVVLIFVIVVSYAGMMLLQWPFMVAAVMAGPESAAAFWLNLTGAVTGTLASMVTTPLTVVALAVLYYDLRIRKEGLDVELLVSALDGGSDGSTPSGARGFILPS